jgi:hypothetical protein
MLVLSVLAFVILCVSAVLDDDDRTLALLTVFVVMPSFLAIAVLSIIQLA